MDLIMKLQQHGAKLPWDKLIGGVNAAIEGAPFGFAPGNYEDIFKKEDCPFPEDLVENITEPAYAIVDWEVLGEAMVHPYLEGRGVSYEVAERFDLRFDPYRNRIVAPVRDFQGQLMGLHGRTVFSLSKLPYLMYTHQKKSNPHVMLGEHLVTADVPVIVAESMFDLFRVVEVWPNCLSPLKAGISVQTIKRLEGSLMVITLFDGDKAGEHAREKIDKHLKTCPVHHLIPEDGTDAGEMDSVVLECAIAELLDSV